MATTLPDIAILNNDLRRRRWIIRFCLLSLFILLILTVIACVMWSSPTGMTTHEAATAFAHLKLEHTRADAERLLGKPVVEYKELDANGVVGIVLTWQFLTPDGLGNIEYFECTVRCNETGIYHVGGSKKSVIKDWKNILISKWIMLKRRLGI